MSLVRLALDASTIERFVHCDADLLGIEWSPDPPGAPVAPPRRPRSAGSLARGAIEFRCSALVFEATAK